jgi:hypothetical protein
MQHMLHGMDVDDNLGYHRRNLFALAVRHGASACTRYFLAGGDDIEELIDPIQGEYRALENGHLQCARTLLEARAPTNRFAVFSLPVYSRARIVSLTTRANASGHAFKQLMMTEHRRELAAAASWTSHALFDANVLGLITDFVSVPQCPAAAAASAAAP